MHAYRETDTSGVEKNRQCILFTLILNDLLEYKPKITLKIDFWTHAITNFVMAVNQQHGDASFLDCPL